DHADLAVQAGLTMLSRLEVLNQQLVAEGQAPLAIGIGIHSGLALVGCIGATLDGGGGTMQVRREFTAIGETVNLAQRMEQLTKVHGGPILLSEQTRQRLKCPPALIDLGPRSVPGYKGS